MDFTYRIETNLAYEQAIERVTETLKDQGFGVLTRIDMRQTLKDYSASTATSDDPRRLQPGARASGNDR